MNQLGIFLGLMMVTQVSFSSWVLAADSVANPLRKVIVKPVAAKMFQLPNGAAMDLSADLDVMFNTELTSNSHLSPSEFNTRPACHIEVQAAISTLELDINEYGIKVGFNPSGPMSTSGPTLGGNVTVKGGLIAMDFRVSECDNLECHSIAAASESHATSSTQLNFGLNLGMITIGPNLIHNTELGGILRAIMDKGIKDLINKPEMQGLIWQATIIAINPDGTFLIDAGERDRLKDDQQFTVLTKLASPGSVCGSYQSIGYAHTSRVDNVSSTLKLDGAVARPLNVGDVVMIRTNPEMMP